MVAAYDAPFPDETFKEGARQFPTLVPTSPQDPAHDANVAAWAVLATFTKPFFCCLQQRRHHARRRSEVHSAGSRRARARRTRRSTGSAHFLQEENGPQLAGILIDFIAWNQK